MKDIQAQAEVQANQEAQEAAEKKTNELKAKIKPKVAVKPIPKILTKKTAGASLTKKPIVIKPKVSQAKKP